MTPEFIVKGIIGGHFNKNQQEYGDGHTAAIAVLMQESERTDNFYMTEAPSVNYEDMTYIQTMENRKIRVYTQVDARLVIDDFFAKLAVNYPEANS